MKLIQIILPSIIFFGCSKNKETFLVDKPEAIMVIKHINSTSTSILSEGINGFSKSYDEEVFKASVSVTEIGNKETKKYLFKIVDNEQVILKEALYEGTEIDIYKSGLLEITIKPEQNTQE